MTYIIKFINIDEFFGVLCIHNGNCFGSQWNLCAKIVDFNYVCSICYTFYPNNIPLSLNYYKMNFWETYCTIFLVNCSCYIYLAMPWLQKYNKYSKGGGLFSKNIFPKSMVEYSRYYKKTLGFISYDLFNHFLEKFQ